MTSPLEEAGRRRRRWPRRLAALVAALLAGVAVWLTLGAGEVSDPRDARRLGGLAPPPPSLPEPEVRERSPGRGGARRDAASVSFGRPDTLDVELEDPPASALVFDAETGRVLFRLRPRDERPVASLTKIMTTLLVAEQGPPPERSVEVGGAGAGLDASGGVLGSAVGLEAGMRVKSGSLFNAMLIASANDAASALAVEVSGSVDRFVARMNRRARRLSLECSHFVSPHGLEAENRSCAADLAGLARLAAQEERITRVASKRQAVVDFPIPGGERHLATTNPLLQTGYDGTVGLKTGFTADAGRSFVALVRRDGRTLGAVLLDSPDPGGQAKKLLDAAFGGGDGARGNRGAVSPPREPPRLQAPRPRPDARGST